VRIWRRRVSAESNARNDGTEDRAFERAPRKPRAVME
jgi:hypothetical protein